MSKAEEINSLESLKDFIISKDNSKSFVYFSPIPDYLKTEKCILGGENFFVYIVWISFLFLFIS